MYENTILLDGKTAEDYDYVDADNYSDDNTMAIENITKDREAF